MAIPKLLANIPIPRPFCGTRKIQMRRLPGRTMGSAAILLLFCSAVFAGTHRAGSARRLNTAPVKSGFNIQELEKLSRALKSNDPGPSYAQLSAAASQKSTEALGLRAALALGYYDYGRAHFAQAGKWLAVAKTDATLRDYALYWNAETEIAQGDSAGALG